VDILGLRRLFREGDPVNRYPFIEAERAQRHDVRRACELMKFPVRPLRIARRRAFTASLARRANPASRDMASDRQPFIDDFRMSMPRAPRYSTKLSLGPYSVRRMTEHDHRCESTGGGLEERLRFLRQQAGLMQAQLADELGTWQYAIARLERGLRRPSFEAVSRVATALGCETGMLIEQKGIA
jgi:ribosome-binding protein aMBF1 (putative translation factor)